MKVADFDFDLPPERIADVPVSPRDASRLLQVSKFFFDFTFSQLPDLLDAGDVLVFNDSKVMPARLFAQKGEATIELLLHKPEGEHWLAFARPGKKLKPGDGLVIAPGFEATVLEKRDSGEVLLSFNCVGGSFEALLETHGHVPLPPYIRRADAQADRARYQTVYARDDAARSVAAPTAGLHFTPELLQRCDAKGIHRAHLTLHVGAGTFQPVKAEDTGDHVMHHEWAEITPKAAETINRARASGGRVVAVGTTALRTLESAAAPDGSLAPFQGETDLFITPGYAFKVADRLITNFHLPRSTLFMLVSAFSGLERMKAAYAYAIEQDYRFYSYGDACLLDRV